MTDGVTNEEPQNGGTDDEQYVSFGYFDPWLGQRVIKRLASEGVRFRAHDASRVAVASTPIFDCMTPRYLVPYLGRLNRIELFVHSDDGAKAHELIDQV
jgi:hypothetical protein